MFAFVFVFYCLSIVYLLLVYLQTCSISLRENICPPILYEDVCKNFARDREEEG